MTFTDFIQEILNSYISENPEKADIYSEQINAIVDFRNDLNGYGAYSYFTLQSGCQKFTGEDANNYGNNGNFIIMEGRDYELGFLLSIKDGLIESLEIYPNDGKNWNGEVKHFHLSKVLHA